MRQIYETQIDLDNEKSIRKTIETACGMHLRKMSIKYSLDFIGFPVLSARLISRA